MEEKKKRAPNFSQFEMGILLALFSNSASILENKSTDGCSLREKQATSLDLTSQFNTVPAVMEVIKIEREIDTLAFEGRNNTDIEEMKLQEGNLLDLQVIAIKTECMDHSYEVKPKMTFDKTDVPIDISFAKREIEEGNILDLDMTEIKTECMDQSYDLKSEMTFEEPPVPIDFPVMKSEPEDGACEIHKEQDEVELQVTAGENEVFTEGTGVPPCCHSITEDECLETYEETFKCDICGESFFDSIELKRHTALLEPKRPLISDDCGKDYMQVDLLKTHACVHTDDQTCSCDICRKKFSGTIRRTGNISLSCDVCGKKFSKSGNLKRHSVVHTGEKAFGCDICGKKFSLCSNLKKHTLVHTGEKPLGCDICGKKFSQSSALKTHALIHTGEKPFGCVVCGRKFSESGSLKRHSVVHTGEKAFSCDICGMKFSLSSNLKKHTLVHTGEKAFGCDICGRKFSVSSSLKRHAILHTRGVEGIQ
ncbi:zinc finger protein 431-like isoform X2 [Periplaneta americana]|uniref:zinc finger protein 431-like isoform X2 n=2 Tax=Periplaneta americana TaxID=6978 RepID=UPI0037E973BD